MANRVVVASPVEAVRCATEIQLEIDKRNIGLPEPGTLGREDRDDARDGVLLVVGLVLLVLVVPRAHPPVECRCLGRARA